MTQQPKRPEFEATRGVVIDMQGAVAVVMLDRPERRNALTATLIAGLAKVMAELDAADDVGAVVLTGRDPAFCAGLDLDELASTGENIRSASLGAPWPRMVKPLIGAVNGDAVTGGLELLLHCDFLVASEYARFADTHCRVGVLPGWGLSVLLPQAIGVRRAKEMSTTGNFIAADEALEWGLVNHVVPHDQLLPRAIALANDALSNDTPCMQVLLALYDDNSLGTSTQAFERESRRSQEWMREHYAPERVAARRAEIKARGSERAR
jgi:enoyl-CoA hydratase